MSQFLLSLAAASARILPGPLKRLLYRIDPLARLIRGSLNRAAPEGLTLVTIAAGLPQGLQMRLDLHAEKDYWLGTYEAELQQALLDWVLPGCVVYDVGANVGFVSLCLARRVGETGQVLAFEALPSNLERLRENVRLNALENCIHVIDRAVVDRAGVVKFLVGPSGGMGKAQGSAGRKEFTYSQTLDVQGVSLDEWVQQEGMPTPQVIKLDIEGGEVLALPGMKQLLKDAHPVILMEMHGPQAAQVSWDILTQQGYSIRRMAPEYPPVDSFQSLDWKSYLIAVPQHE